MKQTSFLLFMFICSISYGQDTLKMKVYNSAFLGGMTYEVPVTEKLSDTSIVRKFNHAFDLFFSGEVEQAISIWQNIVVTSKDTNSHVYGMSFFFVADAYFATEQVDSAEVWFQKILASSLVDSTETGDIREIHGNYKYHSCKRLSSIYGFYKVDYPKAIAYIDSAENNYPYYGFPGSMTSVMKEKAMRVWWKAKMLYIDMQDEEAYYTLLNEFYKSDYPSYFEESNQFLLEIITENMPKEDYLIELNNALDKLTVETKENLVTGTFTFRKKIYSVTIAKDKKDVVRSEDSPIIKGAEVLEKNKEYFANRIKKSSFYKSLNAN